MYRPSYRSIKRSRALLIAVGLIDLAVQFYCSLNNIAYSAELNVLAIVAGVFLIRNPLRTAALVRLFAAFGLGMIAAFIAVVPLLQPIDLIFAYFRLRPGIAFPIVFSALLRGSVLLWICWALGKQPVLMALRASRVKPYKVGMAAVAGVVLVMIVASVVGLMLNTDSAARMEALAQQQLGSTYQYHASSLSIRKSSEGTTVLGVVTAWNDQEIRQLRINWKEP